MLRNPRLIKSTPFISVFAIDGGNVGQVVRMWHERTAAGQNLWSWVGILIALFCWWNYYRVKCPDDWSAPMAALGGFVCAGVIVSIIYWRYVV